MKLTGSQDCPKGIDTAPGSINCRKCKHYRCGELVHEGPMSCIVIECEYEAINIINPIIKIN